MERLYALASALPFPGRVRCLARELVFELDRLVHARRRLHGVEAALHPAGLLPADAPAAAQGARQVLFVSSCTHYFDRFHRPLVESCLAHSAETALHFHLVLAPGEAVEARWRSLVALAGEVPVFLSHSPLPEGALSGQARISFLQVSRFLMLEHVLRQHGLPVIVSDIDAVVASDLGRFAAREHITLARRRHICRSKKIMAGFAVFPAMAQSLTFAQAFRDLFLHVQGCVHAPFLDQRLLHMLVRRHGRALGVSFLPHEEVMEYDDPARAAQRRCAFYSPKGKRKALRVTAQDGAES